MNVEKLKFVRLGRKLKQKRQGSEMHVSAQPKVAMQALPQAIRETRYVLWRMKIPIAQRCTGFTKKAWNALLPM